MSASLASEVVIDVRDAPTPLVSPGNRSRPALHFRASAGMDLLSPPGRCAESLTAGAGDPDHTSPRPVVWSLLELPPFPRRTAEWLAGFHRAIPSTPLDAYSYVAAEPSVESHGGDDPADRRSPQSWPWPACPSHASVGAPASGRPDSGTGARRPRASRSSRPRASGGSTSSAPARPTRAWLKRSASSSTPSTTRTSSRATSARRSTSTRTTCTSCSTSRATTRRSSASTRRRSTSSSGPTS